MKVNYIYLSVGPDARDLRRKAHFGPSMEFRSWGSPPVDLLEILSAADRDPVPAKPPKPPQNRTFPNRRFVPKPAVSKRNKQRSYSTTSSASASSVFGMLSPIALAVFRLSTNRKCVGCSTGRSAGLVPLKM